MSKKAFTLIELICVIAILSIMAAFILPRYNQTQRQAIIKQEDAIIVALKEAINHKHMLNVLNGQDVWPGDPVGGQGDPNFSDPFLNDNPFELLNPKPPCSYEGAFAADTQKDCKNWRYYPNKTANYWEYFIHCPHYSRNYGAGGGTLPYRGDFYIYCYYTTGAVNSRGLRKGELQKISGISYGH